MHWRGGGGGAEGGPFESGEEKEGCSAAGARGGTGTRTAAARRWTKRLQPQFGGVQTGRRVPSDQRGEKLGADDWTVKPVTAAAAAATNDGAAAAAAAAAAETAAAVAGRRGYKSLSQP